MALIQTVSRENAEGKVKDVYDKMMETVGTIPKPLKMLSVSPELLSMQMEPMGYFMAHPTLTFPLLAHIRLLVAHHFNYGYCVEFNSGILQMFAEVTDEQLDATLADPAGARLDEKELALLQFVLKAIKTPDAVGEEDIAPLHVLGWTDRDIFDATAHGADMVRHGTLFKAFKMDQE